MNRQFPSVSQRAGTNSHVLDTDHTTISGDPAVYLEYEEKWASLPQDQTGWIQRAQEVADVLAADAVQRDQENKSPRAEVALLKYSGLLKILGPATYGGGEQPWSVGYKAIRIVAQADG
jgi:alkylation response protein AidB-like acyl-CoA dehydrogenase